MALATTQDFDTWALTCKASGTLPSKQDILGVRELFEAARIDSFLSSADARQMERHEPAAVSLEALRDLVSHHAGHSQENDQLVFLRFQSVEKRFEHLAGAKSFLNFLHAHDRILTESTEAELIAWSQTPVMGHKRTYGKRRSENSIKGARALYADAVAIQSLPFRTVDAAVKPEPRNAPMHDAHGDDTVMQAVRDFLDAYEPPQLPSTFEVVT